MNKDMETLVHQVLIQAPAEATHEDAQAALERCSGDPVAAIACLWEGMTATQDREPKRARVAPKEVRAVDLMEGKDAESVNKINEMRKMCDRMNIQMEQLLKQNKST